MEIKLEVHVTEALAKMDGTLKDRMEEAVNEVKKTIQYSFLQPARGRTYENYFWTDPQGRLRLGRKRWKPHTASAPGDPPAKDSGELSQSIDSIVAYVGTSLVGSVGIPEGKEHIPHGKRLEYGTSKMAARPWLRPAFEKSEEKIKGIFERSWE